MEPISALNSNFKPGIAWWVDYSIAPSLPLSYLVPTVPVGIHTRSPINHLNIPQLKNEQQTMDFALRLIIMPLGIAILSIIGVYTFGITGVFVFSLLISLYYAFALNAVRNWSPNGNTRKTSPSKTREYLLVSFSLSLLGLYGLHFIFSFFNN